MASLPGTLNDLMMAQQPIFDKKSKLFGYELLFRNNDETMANVIDGEDATSQVLVNLCIGITELETQMRTPYFVNITRDLLMSDAFFPIDPTLVYIEILEDQKITPTFVESVAKWHKAGYRFVLDDYNFDPSYGALFPYIHMVKIDVLHTDPYKHHKQIQALKDKKLILVAEKVEDQKMYDECKELGFDLFQGYYLQKPSIVKGRRINSSMSNALELVSELSDENITVEKVTKLVSKDPRLSYQLLRILNSPICGLQRKVTNLKEAVVFLGLKQIKKWALLITITANSKHSNEIFRFLLIRAKCCEALAVQEKSPSPDTDFMAGIMSGIDLVLQVEKKIVFEQINLDDEVLEAIKHYRGDIGARLRKACALEKQDWNYIAVLPSPERIALSRSYGEASLWANDTLKYV
ncbi:MAG: EAL and HDOD domain-containing protein [Marinomonas sp.]